jgi:3-oxoadipate CoA-transferase beta subunit
MANGHTGAADVIPAVGGATGVAASARQTRLMIKHPTKTGEPRIVARCSCPLTGVA